MSQARVHSEMPDRDLVIRRPWWSHERTTPDCDEDPIDLMGVLTGAFPWMDRAACTSSKLPPDAWFPSTNHRKHETRDALRTCHNCPVRVQCLDYAMGEARASRVLQGVWGGTTYRERVAMAKTFTRGAGAAAS